MAAILLKVVKIQNVFFQSCEEFNSKNINISWKTNIADYFLRLSKSKMAAILWKNCQNFKVIDNLILRRINISPKSEHKHFGFFKDNQNPI